MTKNLAAIRAHRGLSQQEVANAAGIRRAYVGLLESGRVGGVEVGFQVAQALNVTMEQLFLADGVCPICAIPYDSVAGSVCLDCYPVIQEILDRNAVA